MAQHIYQPASRDCRNGTSRCSRKSRWYISLNEHGKTRESNNARPVVNIVIAVSNNPPAASPLGREDRDATSPHPSLHYIQCPNVLPFLQQQPRWKEHDPSQQVQPRLMRPPRIDISVSIWGGGSDRLLDAQ